MTKTTKPPVFDLFTMAKAVKKPVKALIIGPEKTGKTSALLTFPRVAVVDSERGTDYYAGKPGVAPFAVFRAKSISELRRAIEAVKKDNKENFDTLGIDPISIFYNVAVEVANKTMKPGENAYTKANAQMKTIYSDLVDLDLHVVVIAHEVPNYISEGKYYTQDGTKADADHKIGFPFDFVVRTKKDFSYTISGRFPLTPKGKLGWSVFEPASLAYVEGETIHTDNETQAVDAELRKAGAIPARNENLDADDDMAIKEVAAAFVDYYAETYLVEKLREILGVKSFTRDWKTGVAAAHARIAEYESEQAE